MNELKWDDLRAFLAVVRSGTLAAAAEALEVNASTVHRRIATLEEALNTRLFERGPTGYVATPVGEALIPSAIEAEEAILAFRRTATGHDRSATGPVTLTMPPTLIDVFGAGLQDIRIRCPGLRPCILSDDKLLDLGVDVDIAIRPSAAPPEAAVGRRIARLAWAQYRSSAPNTAAAPEAIAQTSAQTSAQKQDWVLYTPRHGPAAQVAWQRAHVAESQVVAEVSSVGAMRSVLAHSQAHGLLPCYVGDPAPGLERVGPVLPELSIDLWLLIHADLRRSARVRALIDLLEPVIENARPLLEGALNTP